jgi:hypothetical protein
LEQLRGTDNKQATAFFARFPLRLGTRKKKPPLPTGGGSSRLPPHPLFAIFLGITRHLYNEHYFKNMRDEKSGHL